MKTFTKNIYFLGLFVLVASCGTSSAPKKTLTGEIKIDGSSTVYPITEAVAEEFRVEYPDVKVTVGVSGTGGGFKKFGRGETDISDASRLIKESEVQLCNENNIHYYEIPVAYDGLAVLVNPENDWVQSITVEELKKIWSPESQGVIMKWNQIRAEWPNEEIHLFGPGVASGTYDYFTEAIVGKSGSSRGDFTASEDDNVLVQGISSDKFGLGFFGLAYYEENKDKLKLVAVDNGNGAILPTKETVMNKTYAPLSRPMYIYVNSLAVKRPEIVEFIRFYIKNSGVLSNEVGYIALPNEKYEEISKGFESFYTTHK